MFACFFVTYQVAGCSQFGQGSFAIETIDDFRSSQEDLFNFYKKIAESPILETSVKEAATNAMYDVFCTGRQEVFLNNLSGGKYDSNFIGAAPVQKEMVR